MFKPGDKVICINNDMSPIGPALENGRTYTVEKYITLQELQSLPENQWWIKTWIESTNGADMVILKGGSGWTVNRFKPA